MAQHQLFWERTTGTGRHILEEKPLSKYQEVEVGPVSEEKMVQFGKILRIRIKPLHLAERRAASIMMVELLRVSG